MDSIESADALDDFLAGLGAEAEAAVTAESPAEPGAQAESPVQDTPPVSEPVSNEAAPAESVAAEPPVDVSSDPEPTPEPQSPNWESDENPFYGKTQQYEAALKLAAQKAQEKQQAEEYAARQRILDELPNMDPDRARQVVTALQAWDAQQAQAQVRALEAQYEPIAKAYTIRKLGDELSLTADERKSLERFDDPRMLDSMAREMASNRKAREKEVSELRKQIGELKLRAEAQERVNSPVDRVAVGAGGPAEALQNATNIEDFVANLGLPTLSRW